MKVIGYEAEQDCVEIGGEESSMGYHFKSEKNKAAKDLRAKARPERKKSGEGHDYAGRANKFKKMGMVSQGQTHFYSQVRSLENVQWLCNEVSVHVEETVPGP